MKAQRLSNISVIVLMIAISTIAVLAMSPERAESQDADGPMILNDTMLHLIEGMQMTPLSPESADEWQAISIPNGFVRDGLFGYNLLPIGHTYWKDVGTWSTEPLRSTINLGGKVTVTIFATREEGSGSTSADFTFDILRGDEPILRLEASNQRIEDGLDNKIQANGFFPAANDTTVEANTVIKLRIRARCQNGAIMKFGSSKLDSGFSFGSNSLEIVNGQVTTTNLVMEYRDAFMVPWTKLYMQMILNDIIQPSTGMSTQMNSINRTREIYWQRENSPGDYSLLASISYDSTGLQNITQDFQVKVPEPKVSRFERIKEVATTIFWVIFIFTLIIAAPVSLSKWRKRVWRRRFRELPPHDENLPKSKKKSMWKKFQKSKKEQRKMKRQEQKEAKERMRDEGKFSLFSKPPDEGERRPRRSTPAIQAEVLSDPQDELEL